MKLQSCVNVGLQNLKSRPHKFRKSQVNIEFQQLSECDKGPPPLEFDDDDGEVQPTKIEVSKVPDSITEEVLKPFFEGSRSGGCSGAVADITMIRPGVFHVTFHESKGVASLTKAYECNIDSICRDGADMPIKP